VADFKEYDSVEIGNDVWIGTHALIKGGVKIGNGAIVGAYAVVTKDVDDYTIVAGNPARPIRKRFTEEQISMLLSREWWNYSEEELLEKATYFSDIQKFLENGEVERGLL
jgi:Acetyltransferase (isoleucine patch superfamily)